MRIVTCLLFVLITGCSEEGPVRPVYEVPEDLQPFVDLFKAEAASRGRPINIENLIIRYDPTLTMPTCGACNSSDIASAEQKVIVLNDQCWQNDYELEALIFHELGHCVLGRLHLNDLMPSGDPRSMMVANDIQIYAPCQYPIGNDECDKVPRRSYYLDELFDESTPIPDWGQ